MSTIKNFIIVSLWLLQNISATKDTDEYYANIDFTVSLTFVFFLSLSSTVL